MKTEFAGGGGVARLVWDLGSGTLQNLSHSLSHSGAPDNNRQDGRGRWQRRDHLTE